MPLSGATSAVGRCRLGVMRADGHDQVIAVHITAMSPNHQWARRLIADVLIVAVAEFTPPGALASQTLGTLEGSVTLGCEPGGPTCIDNPYEAVLLLRGPDGWHKLIRVGPDAHFTISAPAGVYSLISADTRSYFGVPLLSPMRVEILPRRTTRVEVQFKAGPKLPTR